MSVEVDSKVKIIVEGLLLAAGRPLNLDSIAKVFSRSERPDRAELKTVMDSIAEDCKNRGFELKEVASGFRFQVRQELSEWVANLWEERPPRYTRALLETLSLIAYRQPITRGEIEEVRGVAVSSNIIRTLLDREWVRVVGHRDVPGKPAMFATTRQFLDYFNLKSLQELPLLSDIKDLGQQKQYDVEDDLATQRILEVPEELMDENSFEAGQADDIELLAEEEAIALSKKPLDEILDLRVDNEEAEEADESEQNEAGGTDTSADNLIQDGLQLDEAIDNNRLKSDSESNAADNDDNDDNNDGDADAVDFEVDEAEEELVASKAIVREVEDEES